MAICGERVSASIYRAHGTTFSTHSTGSPHGLGPELGKEDVADFLRDRRDDVDEARNDGRAMLLGDGRLESVQVDGLAWEGGLNISERTLRSSGEVKERFAGGAYPHERSEQQGAAHTIVVCLKQSPDNVGAAPDGELRLRGVLLVVAPDHLEARERRGSSGPCRAGR